MIVLKTLSDTMRGLIEAASQMQSDAPTETQLSAIVERGDFRPAETRLPGLILVRCYSRRRRFWPTRPTVLAWWFRPRSGMILFAKSS